MEWSPLPTLYEVSEGEYEMASVMAPYHYVGLGTPFPWGMVQRSRLLAIRRRL